MIIEAKRAKVGQYYEGRKITEVQYNRLLEYVKLAFSGGYKNELLEPGYKIEVTTKP